ncbi:unnamed protein product [Rhizopus microsporus]
MKKNILPYLKELLYKLDKKSSSREIYDKLSEIYAHLTNSSEEFCIKQTVLDYALLFMDENDNSLRMPNTEQDLLEDIYGFIKISERLSGTTMTMHD